jgi:hypothetical protein
MTQVLSVEPNRVLERQKVYQVGVIHLGEREEIDNEVNMA